MVATILGILLTWFAVSVVTALVVGRLADRGAEDPLEQLLAAGSPDLWLIVSMELGRTVPIYPKTVSLTSSPLLKKLGGKNPYPVR